MKGVAAFLIALMAASFAGAEDEAAVLISGSVTGQNGETDVALNSTDNEYLVGWVNKTQKKVYTRVVTGNGTALGEPVVISTKSAMAPISIAYNSVANEFLVAWQTYTQGKSANVIFVQRVSADGETAGSPVKVASGTKKLNRNPYVLYNSDDDVYMVLWSKEGLDTADAGNYSATTDGLYARFFKSNGTPSGSEKLVKAMAYEVVNDYRRHLKYQGYVARWQALKRRYGILTNHITDGDGAMQIEFMGTDPNGVLVAGPVKINRGTVGNGSVWTGLGANTTTGGYLSTWEDYEKQSGSDTGDIDQRPLNTNGNPSGSEENTYSTGQACGDPVVAFDPDKGNFLVVFWADVVDNGTNVDVRGQFVTSTGTLIGKSFGITSSGDSEAEHAVVYNPAIKKYFTVWAQVAGKSQFNIWSSLISPK